ncbi:hypothetical protein C0993_004035, partial [Termitomyces sp. T159_Od127]
RFVDQADFLVLADQKGLFDALSMILPLLDCQAGADLGNVKAFFAFADAIVQLELNCQEAQQQRDLQEVIFFLLILQSFLTDLSSSQKQRRSQADHDIEMLGSSTARSSKQKANVSFSFSSQPSFSLHRLSLFAPRFPV